MERGDLAGASEVVLDGVANALQLDEAEREHLQALARSARPTAPRRARPGPATVRPVIQQVLDAITEAPAWIRNARHDILAMNPLARALYSPVLDSAVAGATAKRAANTTRFIYLDPAAREFFVDYDRIATDAAAMLQLEAGRDPHDKALIANSTSTSKPWNSPPSPTCASTSTPPTRAPPHPTVSSYWPAGPPPAPPTTPTRETLTTSADQSLSKWLPPRPRPGGGCPPAWTTFPRLYVRPAFSGNGIARTLMSNAHDHADRHGMTRLILDVLPARTGVVSFYRRLGYTETRPLAAESPVPMIYMARAVTSDDILPIHGT
jgi:hypothetical protein